MWLQLTWNWTGMASANVSVHIITFLLSYPNLPLSDFHSPTFSPLPPSPLPPSSRLSHLSLLPPSPLPPSSITSPSFLSPFSLLPFSSFLLLSSLRPPSPHPFLPRLTKRWMQSVLVGLKKARMRPLTSTHSVVRHTTV